MNRKTLLSLLSLLAIMVLGIALAVILLYSGTEDRKTVPSQAVEGSGLELLAAIPSDAVAVRCIPDSEDMVSDPFLASELFKAAGSADAAVSYHHARNLIPLYVFDTGKASDEPSETATMLLEAAERDGLYAEYRNCSSLAGQGSILSGRSLIIASRQENLVKSSLRHLEKGVSVMDAPGFADAASSIDSDDALFLSNEHFRKLIEAVMVRKYGRFSSFFSRFADWIVLDMGNDVPEGRAVYEKGRADFMRILEASEPSTAEIASVLPSYVLFAVSLPMKNVKGYLKEYEAFVDSRQELADYKARLRGVAAVTECNPESFVSGIREIAHAAFKVKGKVEEVNLMRLNKDALRSLYPECAAKDYKPQVGEYKYKDFLYSLFGKLFQLPDETSYVYVDNWIISGSNAAVSELINGGGLEYTLQDKISDAGEDGIISGVPVAALAYFSFTEDPDELRNIFDASFLSKATAVFEGCDYCPFIARVTKEKRETYISVELVKADVKRSKAPVTERDTTVSIPSGPFKVKNSGTGKMNDFYQNSHLSLCLRQDGKDLWGIPFKEKICGTAQTVDYYANGKLQILFGAGSKIYLLDRLGRYVNGFPVDLGKKILLGPAVYDFNGTHRYNIMVLHDDKTIEMYNLKGKKPESWKGISSSETIKSLPERITVGGKSFWIVRTSIQTLIYPFVGGEPITIFEGDKRIRPDSEVKVVDITSVEVECYDGKSRTVKLK